jgi:hypothetical protein
MPHDLTISLILSAALQRGLLQAGRYPLARQLVAVAEYAQLTAVDLVPASNLTDTAYLGGGFPARSGFFRKGADIMARNPAVIRFMGRDSGILVLIKLIQMQMSAGDSEKGLSYTDIGVRFGISRTHVRGLLEEAAQHGDVSLSGRGGRLVALQPSMLQAFDRFLADAMSGHDLLYKFARERMAKEVRRLNF